MHIAGTPYTPLYVAKDEVPAEVLEKEKEIYRAQATAQGKPPQVVDKIAEGRLKDYYSSFVLLEQPYIRDDKKTVGQLIQEKIALIKENIVVRRFARFKVGEAVAPSASGETAESTPVAG
jgi:elongation factor Ts